MNPDRLVSQILKVDGWTQGRLAKELGVSQPTVARWVSGSESKSGHLDALRTLHQRLFNYERPERVRAANDSPHVIPNLKISAGMGSGGLESIMVREDGKPLPQYTDGDWGLPSSAIAKLGSVKGLYALPVIGDSMFPTIAGGSIAFVDTKHRHPSPQGLYAVDYGDGLLVKRVELIGGTDMISIKSDNEQYRDYDFPREDVMVWGRIAAVFVWQD